MNGAELIQLMISFMDDEVINEPFAYQLLNLAKNKIEASRMWVKLRKFKSDYSFSSSDGYNDFKTLPDDFLMTFGDKPLKLISGSEVEELGEVPMDDRDQYRDDPGVFYIYHNTSQFAILGGQSRSYNGTLYYIAETEEIDAGVTWIFPKFSHPLLVIEALIIHRGQVDFDEINARMTREGYGTKDEMEKVLNNWDAQLQTRAQRGRVKKDPFARNSNVDSSNKIYTGRRA